MKGHDVVIQLRKALPRLTNIFTSTVSITSLTKAGDTVTAVTATPHGYTGVGNIVTIQGALTPFDVSSLINDGDGTATAVTVQDHDFTQGYPSTAEMINSDQAEYNGQIISNKRRDYRTPLTRNLADNRELMSVPNRKTITYAIEGIPASPATGTNMRIIQNFASGYNGVHEITVVDPTTFTYEVTKELGSPAEGTIIAAGNYRIANIVNFGRLVESYTKQTPTEAWAFVSIGSHRASRDVYVNSDFQIENLAAFDYRQSVEQEFSVFVVLPTKTIIGAGDFSDLFSQDINMYLIKSLVGVEFNSNLSNNVTYRCSFVGNVPFLYTKSFLIHEYQFTQCYYLTIEDTFDNDISVAFRDLELKFDGDAGELMNTEVNLDDDPLP